MEITLGLLALVLSVTSLVWQLATHVLTGGRVKVQLQVGMMADGAGGIMAGKAGKVRHEDLLGSVANGYGTPVIGVQVTSVGRMPVTVQSWSLQAPNGVTLTSRDLLSGPRLPHHMDTGTRESWYVGMDQVAPLIESAEALDRVSTGGNLVTMAVRSFRPTGLRAIVQMGNGRWAKSQRVLLGEPRQPAVTDRPARNA